MCMCVTMIKEKQAIKLKEQEEEYGRVWGGKGKEI